MQNKGERQKKCTKNCDRAIAADGFCGARKLLDRSALANSRAVIYTIVEASPNESILPCSHQNETKLIKQAKYSSAREFLRREL